MKNLQSITEKSWVELKQIALTEEQQAIMLSDNKELIEELILDIKSKREIQPTEEEIEFASKIYDKFKPLVSEDDLYELVCVNVLIDDNNKLSGILNCRINGNHKQIRF